MQTLLCFALTCALLADPACGTTSTAGTESQSKEKERKDEPKKKSKSGTPVPGAGESPESAAKERRAISRVLRSFADGFEGHSPRSVLENLDEQFDDLPRFEDQVSEFLKQSGEMRLFLREASGDVKGDKATLIVDAEMAFATKDEPTRQQSRRERVQFDFVRTAKGWKIYEITPRHFFTP